LIALMRTRGVFPKASVMLLKVVMILPELDCEIS